MLNNSGDCAVYAIKFIELDMQGLGLASLNDDLMVQVRYKMAVDIFLQDWDPVVDYSIEDSFLIFFRMILLYSIEDFPSCFIFWND